ncbi:MAG: ABC transporter substrate-binding protein [Sulfolobales archaeon]
MRITGSILAIIMLIIGVIAGYAGGSIVSQPRPPQIATATVTVAQPQITTITQSIVQASYGLQGEIPIGALLPLSGAGASDGARMRVAVLMAQDDLNNFVKNLGIPVTFRVLIEDTATDPTTALNKLTSLYARGVRTSEGPYTSAELRAIRAYANSNKIVLCSQSTAADLALPDYAFRLPTNDLFQAKALARLVMDYGVKYTAIIYRNDPWGKGLADSFSSRFTALGGSIVGSPIPYDPTTSYFSSYVATLASIVRDAVTRYGAKNVAVVTMSFDEIVAILSASQGYPELMGITWFGTDVTAGNPKVISEVGVVAARVKLISTVFAVTSSPVYQALNQRYRAIGGGEDMGTYAATAYDCIWLIGLSILLAGKNDGEAIAKVFPQVASRYFGASGWTLLDENGDRAAGSYDIFAVTISDGKPTWIRVATWDSTTDKVTWITKI